jgi:menaquinone-dependent protoporphyrinogen oxidase
MADKVLVAHATLHGSTQEVAEAVAGEMREGGWQVECKPANDVETLEGYSAVVLGSAIYMFHLHKDAKRFLARHRDALVQRPVAIFAMGPFHDEEKEWSQVRGQLDSELAKFPWLHPVAREVFGGKFDPGKLRFPYKYFPVLRKMPASDIRDWVAIRAWARELAEELLPVEVAAR